ncbi:hypothetical protein WJX74_000789 [Apatococcus lobatus]
MSLVDTALVGRLGAAELGAVGLSSLIFNLSNFLFNFLLIVTTPKIAAAVARSDTEAASQTTAQGLWIGAGIGIIMGTAIWFLGPPAMQALQAEPAVAQHAVTYLRCRAVASPAVLSLYVVIGSFRGWADTRTPLVASIFANVANLVGDCVLMFGFGWGVAGAALATSFSQYCSLAILLAMGIRKGMLKFSDLRYPPDPRDIGALLRSGLALSLRNTANLAVIMSVTGLVTKLGSIHLAAHEIIRQVYIFSLQSFSSFDIAAQTLIASYLGRGNRAVARDVLVRVVQIGTAIGIGMMLLIFNFRSSIPRIFSQDPAVVKLAADTLIVIALYLPLDAVAQILEGGLLGASDTGYIGKAAIVTAGLAFAAVILTFQSYPNLPGLWFGLKTLTLGRLATGSYRYISKNAPLGILHDAHLDATAPDLVLMAASCFRGFPLQKPRSIRIQSSLDKSPRRLVTQSPVNPLSITPLEEKCLTSFLAISPREASGTATRARAEDLCQSAARDQKSPSDFVIGALVALEADAETVGAAGNLQDLDGSWRLIFSSSAPIPPWRYIPIPESFIVNVADSSFALKSQLGFIGTNFQGSFTWDPLTSKLNFGFNQLLLSCFSWRKTFKLDVSWKTYTWFYVRDSLACARSSEGGLIMMLLESRNHPTHGE